MTALAISIINSFEMLPASMPSLCSDLGISIVTIALIGSTKWEPANDNSNPDAVHLDGFKLDCFDWDFWKRIKKGTTVEHIGLASWSPPYWMKFNKSYCIPTDYASFDNKLDPFYYKEFGECLAGIALAFRNYAGFDLHNICLQNEPVEATLKEMVTGWL